MKPASGKPGAVHYLPDLENLTGTAFVLMVGDDEMDKYSSFERAVTRAVMHELFCEMEEADHFRDDDRPFGP
jgi:hypothetical protein